MNTPFVVGDLEETILCRVQGPKDTPNILNRRTTKVGYTSQIINLVFIDSKTILDCSMQKKGLKKNNNNTPKRERISKTPNKPFWVEGHFQTDHAESFEIARYSYVAEMVILEY